MSGLQGIRDRVVSAKKNPTVRDFIAISGRGRVHNPIVGGPKEVADQLEQWFTAPACDGFVLSATHVPGAYEDFVRFVVPGAAAPRRCSARTSPASRCGKIWGCRCRRSARGAVRRARRRLIAPILRPLSGLADITGVTAGPVAVENEPKAEIYAT